MADFSGTLDRRIALATRLIDEAAAAAEREYAGALDLMVFPEFAFDRKVAPEAIERAIAVDDPALRALSDRARLHGTWIVAPLTLHETGARALFSNAAVLFDRGGAVAGVFRKVHPVADQAGIFEGGGHSRR